MHIQFKNSFKKDLKNKDAKVLKQLKEQIEEIEKVKLLSEIPNLKKIHDNKGNYYRLRMGDYRLGLKFKKGVLIFIRFLHRKEIYRYFP